MRITRASLIIHLLFFFSFEAVSSTENPESLKNIVELAYSNNPLLKEKEAQIYALNGRKKEAEALLFNNPDITSSKGWRRPISNSIETEKKNEWGIGVSQKIEILGKQKVREAIADADILSLQADYADLKSQVRMEASILYYKIVYIKEKIKLDQKTLSLFSQAEKIVNLRKNSGEDTLLDTNIAKVETQLASNDLLNSEYSLMNAKTSLAILLQTQENMLPDIQGKLDDGSLSLPYSYEDIKESLNKQPELMSLSYQEESKKKSLSLEEKTRYPDVTIGVNYSNDGSPSARESLVALSLSIPIPVFQRNFSAIGQATTDLVQTSIKKQAVYSRSQKDMEDLWRKINSMKESINILKNNIMPLSLKNDELASSSQRIGQIGLMDLILINKQAVSANQKLLDVLLEYQVTRLTLERIIGVE